MCKCVTETENHSCITIDAIICIKLERTTAQTLNKAMYCVAHLQLHLNAIYNLQL